MRTAVKVCVGAAVLAAVLLVLSPASQAIVMFNSSTNVNVLREFTFGSSVNQVTAEDGPSNWNSRPGASIDGSGYNDEKVGGFTAGVALTNTFSLPGPRTVGSYRVHYETPGTAHELQGLVGGVWTSLDSFAPGAGVTVRTFTPATVDSLRYIATGASGDSYMRMLETHVYLDSSVSQPMYGGRGSSEGTYNYLRDLYTAGKISGLSSVNNTAWSAPNGGNFTTLVDANFQANELKAQNLTGGNRAFVRLALDQAYQMDAGTLGGTKGQGWQNWELYTYNGGLLDPTGLSTNDVTALTGQGWVLQHTQGAGVTQVADFLFNAPGGYNQLLLVWDVQFGAENNLEIFGFVPEPTTALLLGLGALVFWWRRPRR